MLTPIRLKKKKEAVRRLSQGSGSASTSSHAPGQWPQRRKFPDQHRAQRQQPYEANQRPAKRSHISPLHQDSVVSSGNEPEPVKPVGTAAFTFGTAQTAIGSEATQFTHTTTISALSPFSTAPSYGSAFSASAGEATSSSSDSGVLGSVFGSNTLKTSSTLSSSSPNTSVNVFAPPTCMVGPQIPAPSFGISQASTPIFSSGFHRSTASKDLVSSSSATSSSSRFKLGDSIKQPSSTALTFGSFSNLGSSPGTSRESSSGGVAGDMGSDPSFPFGTAPLPHERKSSAASSVSKPLFPIMQSSSTFSTAKMNNPGSGTAGIFGRTFATATGHHQEKENKDKVVEKKVRGLPTADLTALVIRDIPEMYNKNAWLRRFYSRFGEVTKVVSTAARKSATITFKTHEAAEAAKKRGKILRQGLPPVEIFWKQQGKRRSTTSESDQQSPDIDKSVGRSPEKGRKMLNQAKLTDDKSLLGRKSSEALKGIQDYLKTVEPSENAGEKLQVLEGIDKKLRQVFKRTSDISSAKAVTGTCKDMCPEKERYMREHQRRLSVFEAIPGTGSIDENPQVNHACAIKEYDRSAADKEEPLPHELRPVPVLKMTMDYLATNIMDLVEGREGEWFDFVWNRTRGIRKDITQQHLCDPDCVDLVEKTARFHIICAHLLCEEDMNSFDAKINTENLTKCLQTLKQFYGDLYKDKGVTCPHEAEFRAYDILLNLNEGDILRETMTFREEVQKSAEVRFAMDIFHALNSNNFVRFFRLLRNAKYLSACLLHRYFTQVRGRAIQTLNHSLSISNRSTPFQLKDLVDILAFEDESKAEEFCTYHGLNVTEGCVNFARSSFVEPETRFPVKRALKLIESKRNSSIGEVVYNGPLPPPPQHKPCLSFDDDGRYIGDTAELVAVFSKENAPASQTPDQTNAGTFDSVTPALPLPGRPPTESDTSDRQLSITPTASPGTAVGVVKQPLVQTVHRPFTQPPQEQPRAKVVYTGEEIMHFTKSLFLEVLNEMCTEITKDALDKVHYCLQLSSEIADDFHEQTLSEFTRETASAVLSEERENKRIAEENAATKERVSCAVHGNITEEFVSQECTRIVEDVLREVREELLKIARENASRKISLCLVEEGVLGELQNLAWEVLEEEKAERDARLQQLAEQIIKRRTARYFKRWVKYFRSSVHLKGLLSTFPPGAPMFSTEEQLEYLVGYNRQSITMAAIRTGAHEREILDALEKRQAELGRIRQQACKPLDIPSLLADSMRSQPEADRLVPRSPIYWKLIISLPEGCEEGELTESDRGRFMSFVIREKFKRGMYPLAHNIPQGLKKKIDLLSLYRAEIRSFPMQSRILKICTKACYGVLTNSEAREVLDSRQFLGACAAIFVVDLQELQLNQRAAREAHIRLRRVLESKPPEPRLPVAVIIIDNDKSTLPPTRILSILGIQQLRTDGLLSECKLFDVSSNVHPDDLSQTLNSAVTWLGRHMLLSSLPKTDSLVNYIEDGVQREFTVAVAEDLFIRKQAKLEQQCPEAIIDLFNSVLDHLGAVVSSHSLQRLSWPISELTDKETLYQETPHVTWNSEENLQRLRSCITALKLPPPPPAADDGTWETESELCLEYARCLSPNSAGLLNRVQWILARAKRVLDEINFLSTSLMLSASKVPWPLVVDACVNFRLTCLHSDAGLAEQDVHYLEEELNAFVQPLLWRQSAKTSKEEAASANNTTRRESSRPRKNRDTKLHESFLDVEQQLDEIKGTSQVNTSPSQLTTSLVTPSLAVTPTSVTPSIEVKPCSTSSDPSVQVTSAKLKAALEEAKMESKRFEELLKNVLGDSDSPVGLEAPTLRRKRKAQSLGESKKSPKLLEGLDIPHIDLSFGSLEESLSCFNETLKSQRRSDVLIERRLKECLES